MNATNNMDWRRQGATPLVLALVCTLAPAAPASYYQPPPPSRAKDFTIIRKAEVIHIFYTVDCYVADPDCGDTTFGHVTTTDFQTFTRHDNVLENTPGEFDEHDMWAPSLVESNGLYYLFYTGVRFNGNAYVQKIGVATSSNLYDWEKHPDNPIVSCEDFAWAHWDEDTAWRADCRDPGVTWDAAGNRWIMTVSGRPAANPARMRIGVAESSDLIHWTELGSIEETTDRAHVAESAQLIQRNGSYFLQWTDNAGVVWATTDSPTGDLSPVNDIDGDAGFAAEIVQIGDLWIYAEALGQSLHFQEFVWGEGLEFTIRTLATGSIQGSVYHDADGSGNRDEDEAGMSQVGVELYLDDGNGVFEPGGNDARAAMTPSQAGGAYAFTSLLPGRYWVFAPSPNRASGEPLEILIPSANAAEAPYCGNPHLRVVPGGASTPDAEIGFVASASISGVVFHDVDRDGTPAVTEELMVDLPLELLGADTAGRPVTRQVRTAIDGSYRFDGLLPGTYAVTLAGALPHLESTTGTTLEIVLAAGEDLVSADLGFAAATVNPLAGAAVEGSARGKAGRGPTWQPNRPNPFNPSTVLSFSVPAGGRAIITVYDAAGRLVARPLDAVFPAGSHEVVWRGVGFDGRALPSGAYVCRLESGGVAVTRSVLLLR